MKITDFLTASKVAIQAQAGTRDEAIRLLVGLQNAAGAISDPEEFEKDILAREAKGTTCIGEGLAVPHAKSTAAKEPSLAAVTLVTGVDYQSPDGQLADLIFMIATPPGGDAHLEILSRMMVLLMDADLRQKLRAAKEPEEFVRIVDEAEIAKYGSETKTEEAPPAEPEGRILAVTACPTGVAHTYMAAEALDKAAQKLSIPFKVETNGSTGIQNPLTAEDIKLAPAIIVAADKQVETERFVGKKVIFVKVADGIHKPEALLKQAQAGEAPIYEGSGEAGAGSASSSAASSESWARGVYKDLMNGVSHMLPFVIGGGVLIALAFLFDDYSINPASFGSNTSLAKVFMNIGQAAFSLMLPILAGFIALSIADRPGLAPGVVGGLLAKEGLSFGSLLYGSPAVSGGFLAALLAGFLAGYVVLGLKKLTENMPRSLKALGPVLIFPLLGSLLVGLVMLGLNPLMGVINSALANGLNAMGAAQKIPLGVLLAAMMSADMGGPINKAAYVFGVASIASGNYEVMAAVMIGGMVPPIAIALAATFFPNRFTPEERHGAPVNYVMGLCFITEGAIPYAAADPLRVIPSCLVGAGLSGGLAMAFNCGLMAPHGGVFVFPVVKNPGAYLLALVLGSLLGMALLAILKKKIPLTAARASA
ncbi:MAG: fructose-specific PTS transporter subunit EIIC [Deltaproteobacteria bacterium]|jgi:PTS system fructose-specific IIC component|nr:fructose-specific PTS transporter subunit EIIC [Deltaproteobacteria bacterium]